MATVSFEDLDSAFEWVSAAPPFCNFAYISKATGQIFFASDISDGDEDLPDDLDDASQYWSVPHKNDLDLGRELVLSFVDEHLPARFREVQGYFGRRGAYARFRDLIEREDKLQDWYAYESAAKEAAMMAWAEQKGIAVAPPRRRSGG
jgi:hypothetical protein